MLCLMLKPIASQQTMPPLKTIAAKFRTPTNNSRF